MKGTNSILMFVGALLIGGIMSAEISGRPHASVSPDLDASDSMFTVQDSGYAMWEWKTKTGWNKAFPKSVLVDTVTIEKPYIVLKDDIYYMIDSAYLDFDNPGKSLKDSPCYVLFDDATLIYWVMTDKMIDAYNLYSCVDGDRVDIIKKTKYDNIYQFTKNQTKFLITLVRIDVITNWLKADYDFIDAPGYSIRPVVKSEMPYSQYMLVATPLRPYNK